MVSCHRPDTGDSSSSRVSPDLEGVAFCSLVFSFFTAFGAAWGAADFGASPAFGASAAGNGVERKTIWFDMPLRSE